MLTGTPVNTPYTLIDMDNDKYNDFVIVHYADPNAAILVPIGAYGETGTAGVIRGCPKVITICFTVS